MGSSADCKIKKKLGQKQTDRHSSFAFFFLHRAHTHTHTRRIFGHTFSGTGGAMSSAAARLRTRRGTLTGSRCGSMLTVNLQTLAPDYPLILRVTDSSSFLRSLARTLSPLLHWLSKGCYDSGISLPQTPEKTAKISRPRTHNSRTIRLNLQAHTNRDSNARQIL